MNWIEVIAVLFSLVSVILTIKQNVWCWLTGIIGIIGYFYIFLDQKFYCEMLLQTIFIAQSVYGWGNWGKNKFDLLINQLPPLKFYRHVILTTIFSLIVFIFLKHHFNSTQPFLDVFTTIFSLLATWYLTEKYLENWLIWILTDIMFIIMFFNQHLYLSGFLYIIFLVLAVKGLFTWEKELKVV